MLVWRQVKLREGVLDEPMRPGALSIREHGEKSAGEAIQFFQLNLFDESPLAQIRTARQVGDFYIFVGASGHLVQDRCFTILDVGVLLGAAWDALAESRFDAPRDLLLPLKDKSFVVMESPENRMTLYQFADSDADRAKQIEQYAPPRVRQRTPETLRDIRMAWTITSERRTTELGSGLLIR